MSNPRPPRRRPRWTRLWRRRPIRPTTIDPDSDGRTRSGQYFLNGTRVIVAVPDELVPLWPDLDGHTGTVVGTWGESGVPDDGWIVALRVDATRAIAAVAEAWLRPHTATTV